MVSPATQAGVPVYIQVWVCYSPECVCLEVSHPTQCLGGMYACKHCIHAYL